MSCIFKQYKNIFGKEKEGIHSVRIFDIAILDVLGTIVVALIIAWYFKISFWIILLLFFIFAILMHRLFCVNTTVNKFLFGYVD